MAPLKCRTYSSIHANGETWILRRVYETGAPETPLRLGAQLPLSGESYVCEAIDPHGLTARKPTNRRSLDDYAFVSLEHR